MPVRIWWSILLGLLAATLCISALADVPQPLHTCMTPEDIMARMILPIYSEDGINLPAQVQMGEIRYIAQRRTGDPLFCTDYWLGGEVGSALDLTCLKDENGDEYEFCCNNMCTRAVYAMAMSYLGVDVTPGDMSRMIGRRDLDEPYDEVTELLGGVERVTFEGKVFKAMFRHYLEDSAYSPVMVHFRKPDGVCHAVLVISNDEEDRYLVVDPVRRRRNGVFQRVYRIRFDPQYRNIINSTFHETQLGSHVVGLYQWHLTWEKAE